MKDSIIVEDNEFDRFIQACEENREPNKALRDAVEYTRGNNGLK